LSLAETNTTVTDAMDDLHFRKFSPDDLTRCAELAADVWPDVSKLVPLDDKVIFIKAHVELGRLSATWLEVACISDQIDQS
jgi:hypothetical protein